MLTEYVQAALRRARYERLDDCSIYGEIPGFQGVFASAETLEACQEQLRQVLEGWIALGVRLGHALPEKNDLSPTPEREAA